jgi:transposase-like protein
MEAGPKTLLEAVQYFSDQDNCIAYLADKRWPDGVVVCPICGRPGAGFLANQRRWQCSVRHPKRQFSIKVGTIFEDSPLGLDKWLPAMWLIYSNRNGISSWELHRALDVTQKTAWFMLQRIRLAMQDECHGGKIGGEGCEVEIDETYIGGKARNMHYDRKVRAQKAGRNLGNKAVVIGALERGGKVRATVASDRKKATMQPFVKENVLKGSEIHSDEFAGTWRMDEEYTHQVVNHLVTYVDGNVHTNGIENFWSLLKRGINGTYVSVEPFHLFRYVDEQAFRYNNRLPLSDGARFDYLVRKIVGKRLTYSQLIGHEEERPEPF